MRERLSLWRRFERMLVAVLTTLLLMGYAPILTVGASMEPSIPNGAVGLLRVRDYEIERGSVIVFRCRGLHERLVKRVVGLPGDTVELKGESVYVNGEKLREPCVRKWYYNLGDEPDTYYVEAGHFFVLGDNRRRSCDSRDDRVGLVDEGDVCGVLDSQVPLPTGCGEVLHAAQKFVQRAVEYGTAAWYNLNSRWEPVTP